MFLLNKKLSYHIFGGQAASWRWWNTIHLFDAMWALGNGYFYGIVRWAYPVQQQNWHRLKLLNGAFIVGGRQDGLATYFLSTKASKTKNARACDYSKTTDEFMITSCYRQRAKIVMLSEAFSLSSQILIHNPHRVETKLDKVYNPSMKQLPKVDLRRVWLFQLKRGKINDLLIAD